MVETMLHKIRKISKTIGFALRSKGKLLYFYQIDLKRLLLGW